jgi:copper chaperone NosL
MGVVLASFSEEAAAVKLASEQGGRVLRFEEIDLALLQQAPAL